MNTRDNTITADAKPIDQNSDPLAALLKAFGDAGVSPNTQDKVRDAGFTPDECDELLGNLFGDDAEEDDRDGD